MARSRFESRIRENLGSCPEEVAIDFDGTFITWREVNAFASEAERLIEAAGVPEFGRVGLMARNRPGHFATLWSIFASGRCISMLYAFQPAEILASDIADYRCPVIFGTRDDWSEPVIAAAEKSGTVGYAITDDPCEPFVRVTANEIPDSALLAPPVTDTVIELLSSGTTGKPKRIPLSRKSIDELIERTMFQFASGGAKDKSVQIVAWPLSSLGGTNAALPSITLGQTIAIQPKFEARGFLEQLRRYKPTFLSIPPAAMAMVLQLNPTKEDLESVEIYFNGAAPLDPEVRRRLEEDYGLPIANAYGATEFAGIISSWVPEDFALLKEKRGSCGRALPGMQIRIVSEETGEVLPPGETGIVEALVPRVSDDWVRTTDLGYLDDDGFLFLEGRADDAIIRGGMKIHPEEVAEAMRHHPAVGDAAVIGIPDERLGMVPAAVVEPVAGSEAPSPADLEAFLRSRLPAYKIPVRYVIVAEIPRTQSMKPMRPALRALFGVKL